MVGGALYRHNQTPVLRVGDLQTRKQLYRRGSPSGASIPNPRSGSQPGGPALGGGAPRASGAAGQWNLCAELLRTGTSLCSWRAHRRSCALGPGHGSCSLGVWVRPTCRLRGSPGRAGAAVPRGGAGDERQRPWG